MTFDRTRSALAAGLLAALLGNAAAAPANLGLGLRELVDLQATAGSSAALHARVNSRWGSSNPWVDIDARDRVRVKVTLNGQQPLATVTALAESLGSRLLASTDRYRSGAFTAYVPVGAVATLAQSPGVRAIALTVPAQTNVGAVTSQGVAALHTDQVNALGITGAGITVGVMSDSYNTSSNAIKAANDVASGDLPGTGNPLGHTQPVVVVKDQSGGTDEGRAMAQIVHDLAPDAKLCFATAYSTEIDFANNILALADKNGACKADVIVDDIIYLGEPFFSDGIIAQTVDQVVAAGIPYFSSAGNRSGTMGYFADFNPVSKSTAVSGGQTVNLSLIADSASAGGFHNFDTSGGVDVAQTVQVGSSSNTIIFQWNDPFDAGGVTTDYDLYVYNAAGTSILFRSVDDNVATDEPIEAAQFAAGTYQLALVRKASAPAVPVATKLRYVMFGSVITGEYLDPNTPITFGHNSANGAIGTAAYPWYQTYQAESFTSPGPSYMYFDASGARLSEPQLRLKPDVAAIDGVNTTFFSSDSAEDADTFPNFFGTSAAAPHAAGVAALLLQKAGGPGKLPPAQVRSVLQSTALSHALQPDISEAVATAGAAKVTLTLVGNGDNASAYNKNAFKVTLQAPTGYTLQNLKINADTANAARLRLGVAAPGMLFDPRAVTTGFPLTLGTLKNLTPAQVSFVQGGALANTQFAQLTVNFAAGAFTSKSSLSFGVDRDERASGGGGNAAELMAGATVTGTVIAPGNISTPFSTTMHLRQVGKGYSPLDGFGLIDALGAVNALTP